MTEFSIFLTICGVICGVLFVLAVFYLGIVTGRAKERIGYNKLRQEFHKLDVKHARCHTQLYRADQLIFTIPMHESAWEKKTLKEIKSDIYKSIFCISDKEMNDDQIIELLKTMSFNCRRFCYEWILPDNKKLILHREYNKISDVSEN